MDFENGSYDVLLKLKWAKGTNDKWLNQFFRTWRAKIILNRYEWNHIRVILTAKLPRESLTFRVVVHLFAPNFECSAIVDIKAIFTLRMSSDVGPFADGISNCDWQPINESSSMRIVIMIQLKWIMANIQLYRYVRGIIIGCWICKANQIESDEKEICWSVHVEQAARFCVFFFLRFAQNPLILALSHSMCT